MKRCQKIWAGPSPPHLDKIQKNSSSRSRSLFYICLVQISIGSSWLLVNARFTRMCNQRRMEDQDWDKARSSNGTQGKTRQGLIMAFRSDWREIMQPVWRFTWTCEDSCQVEMFETFSFGFGQNCTEIQIPPTIHFGFPKVCWCIKSDK